MDEENLHNKWHRLPKRKKPHSESELSKHPQKEIIIRRSWATDIPRHIQSETFKLKLQSLQTPENSDWTLQGSPCLL